MYESLVEASLHQFHTYGLVLVVLFCVLEGMVVGKIFPAEVVVAAAGVAYAGAIHGPVIVFMLAVIASTSGQYALFATTQYRGRYAVLNYQWSGITARHLDVGERYFARWGSVAVAGANALPVARGLLTVPAAISNVPARVFLPAAIVGNIVYYGIIVGLAVVVGIHLV